MKFNKKLFYVLLIAAVLPSLIFRVFEWRNNVFNSLYEFFESLLFNTIFSIIVTLSIAWVILSILYRLNKSSPWNENILKRLFLEVIVTFPVALLLGYVFGHILFYVNPYHTQSYSDFVFSFLIISAIMNFVLVAISDWFYFFERWKTSLVIAEKEKMKNAILENENLLAQLNSLKKQMNPHFLFNSLNVLSSLIYDDVDKAESFIDEFSDFYRSVLDQTNKDFVSLNQEIETCKSYMFLQGIRFENAIEYHLNIDGHAEDFYIFPLALQTVLENAIKHNLATIESPLKIEVILVDNVLEVLNNIQKRPDNVSSSGMGQKNLIRRYAHFNHSPIFKKTAETYTSYLPILTKREIDQFYVKPKAK